MKIAVLTIARRFPVGHPRAYWKGIVAKVAAGRMYLSVRMWIGKPRQSPQQEMGRAFPTCTQDVTMDYTGGVLAVTIDGQEWADHEALATRDGMTLADFIGWFFPGKRTHWEGVLIHFTDFRY